MRTWLAYAATGLALTLLLASLATLLVPRTAVAAIWFSATLAYTLQLGAFAALLAVRHRSELFLAGWLAGLVARFTAVGVMAYWLSRTDALPRAPALLSLVGFVFVLLLMEPLFLRQGLQAR